MTNWIDIKYWLLLLIATGCCFSCQDDQVSMLPEESGEYTEGYATLTV
ncbi:MAG: hypothetical protein LIP05_10550 [Tannerellaceae bacterium]|nr:hypothetical protein [Tannerellaceae bacterium]